MSLQIDELQARQFLDALAPDEHVFVFQTFDDNPDDEDRWYLSRVITGTLSESLPTLNHLQSQGAGVYVQVQGGTARGQAHMTHGRAVYIDADDPEDVLNVKTQVQQEMPLPSAIVMSSPGKIHVYWWVDATTTDATTTLVSDAADIAGTDPSVRTPERVMRLPGSWHLKNPTAPAQCTLIKANAERRYTAEQLQSIFASCNRRGARAKSGHYAGVTRYDSMFGLPIVDADDMEVLPSGDRTQRLISYIGRLVSEGYSAQRIEEDVRAMAAERLPEGDKPISEVSWRNEILPSIARFQGRMGENVPQAQTPPMPAPTPVANVPGLPQAPSHVPPPPAPAPLPPGMNNTQPVLSEPPSDRPSTDLPMEVWEERFIWVEEGQQIVDTTKPINAGRYSAADFEKSHKNHRAGEGYMFNKWLGNKKRRTVRDFTFVPGEGQVVNQDASLYFNTYEAPKPLLEPFDPTAMRVWEDHMSYLFQDADAWYRMTNWMIFTVASPKTRVPWAPLLVSDEGTGKTWLADCIAKMLDNKYTASVSTDELEGQFNSYVADTLLICFEEVHTRNKHETLDKLKPIITNRSLEVNAKHGRKGQRDIYANVMMTSNHDDALALQMGKDSRRYWVYRINQAKRTPEYYTELYNWLETSGPKHFLAWCMTVDQSDWAFNAAPEYTDAMDTMVKANMSLVTRALTECIDDRIGVFQVDMGEERQIEDTLASWLDQDRLDKRQKMELRHLMRQHTRELRRLKQGTKYLRLITWRHHDMWGQAPDSILLKEYERSKLASLGQDPGTGLTSVRGGVP